MAFISFSKVFTTQADFESPSVTVNNIDTTSLPGSILLAKTNVQNIQTFTSSENFGGTFSSNLELDGSTLKLKPFISRLMNIVPLRTKTQTEDYLSLPFAPLDGSSLVIRANGLNIIQNIDYSVNTETGKVSLLSNYSNTVEFEASYLSHGILDCQGTFLSNPIPVGDEATELILELTGVNLEAFIFQIKKASTELDLDTAVFSSFSINTPVSLDSEDNFLQVQITFIPNNFTTTPFPVTFKYPNDWNLTGSVFNNTSLTTNGQIQIIPQNDNIINVTSLPIPISLAGADYFKDPSTNEFFLLVTGGYEATNKSSASVRYAKINPDHTLGEWVATKNLPNGAVPYNGTKTVNINGTVHAYVLDNDNSNQLFRSQVNRFGAFAWMSDIPLPTKISRGNLEILSDTTSNIHFLIVQEDEFLYWIRINNSDGSLVDNWKVAKLPDKQIAGSTALYKSTTSDTWFLYVLGGSLGNASQKVADDAIVKVSITRSGNNLSFANTKLSQVLPKKMTHFTSEILTIGSDTYLYVFGGTENTETFTDQNTKLIRRAKIDPSTGNLTDLVFTNSPNKLYIESSGHNTVLVDNSGDLCVYAIGDGSRTSARVSCINILDSTDILKSGTYTTGYFQVPGCNIQYGNFNYTKVLANPNQSINAFYRISDTDENLLLESWTPINNGDALVGDPAYQFIQFKFDLEKNPSGDGTETSPLLSNFTFVFTSNISDLTSVPEVTQITYTFDNYLYQSAGTILLRYDSSNTESLYTNYSIDQKNIDNDESTVVEFRAGNLFPLTGPFSPDTSLLTDTVTGRYFDTKITFNASSDSLFSPIIHEFQINGLTPSTVDSSNFIFDQEVIGDQDEANTHFVIQNEYIPGTLQVFVNGAEQTHGLIFNEGLDFQSFDFINYAPDALDTIRVNYIKPL